MRKLMPSIAIVVLIVLLFMLFSVAVAGQFEKINIFRGNVTIGTNSSTNGAIVGGYIGNSASPAKTYVVGALPSVGNSAYALDISCDSGNVMFLKVWGVNATWQTCANDFLNNTNLSVSSVAAAGTCYYTQACSSGVCCSGTAEVTDGITAGTCKSSCAAAADTGGGGGGTGAGAGGAGGGGGGGGAPAPAAPSEETKSIVKEGLPASFQAPEAVVEYKTVAAPEVKEVPVAPETVTELLAQVETIVKTEEAKQALTAIQHAVSSGGASTVSVKKTVEVVKATNKVTKEEVVVSIVKLSVTAPVGQDLKNVEVVEVIPKAAASNVNQVTFKGEQPTVLEADPVVKWLFSEVKKGQSKDMSYVVNKDIRNIGTTTVGVQGRAGAAPAAPEAPPAPPVVKEEEKPAAPPAKKPTPVSTAVLVVVVALVAVGAWLFFKAKRKKVAK